MNRPLKLGIAGLGTVGTGLLQLLAEHGGRLARNAGRSIEVVGVSARSRTKKRAVALKGIAWFDEPARLAADPSIDVFIELIGGEDGAAKSAVEAALAAGKAVVTANKALLARHGTELASLPRRTASPSISRRRWPAASRSSRHCARRWRQPDPARVRHLERHPATTS
jgi:homoserine dehydrogenase